MKTLKYMGRLFGEFVGYALAHKTWWLVPLVLILALFAFLITAGQVSIPFIYQGIF